MNQYSPNFPQPSGAPIAIADVMRGIWHRKAMVLLLTLGAFAVSLAYVLTATPLYSSEAQVLVDRLDTPYDRVQPADPAERQPLDERDILSQVSVLNSQDLAQRVVSALNLPSRAEFDPLKSGLGFVKRLKLALGFGADPRLHTPEQRAMEAYVSRLSVYQIPTSKVIAIRFTSKEPRTAAEVANALAEVYVTSTREAQSEPTGRARGWLSEEIEKLRKRVVESEAAAEEFRAKSGLLQGAQTTLGSQELSELNTQIILADAARSEAQAKAQSIRRLLATRGSVESSSEVLNSPLIQRLREQEAQISSKVAELTVTYLPNHPKMTAANNEMIKLQRQIRGEALKIVEGLEEQAKIAAARVESLRSSLGGLKTRETAANIDEVELRALEREATANRQLLEGLLNRYSDANARQQIAAQPGFARIIQRAAVAAAPSFPKTGPTVLLATIAGCALGLGLAFLLEVMAAASRSHLAVPVSYTPLPPVPADAEPRPITRTLPPAARADDAPPKPLPTEAVADVTPADAGDPMPSLCELPRSASAEAAMANAFEVMARPQAAYATAIRRIASWAIGSRQTLGVKRLGIGAVESGLPDSLACVAGLARALAGHGAHVIVVDAAQSPRELESLFGANPGPGLAEVLIGQAAFSDVILKDEASSAHVLRAGIDASAALGFISSQRMDKVLEALDEAYDVVLVHAGDINGLSATVLKRCHAVLLISPASRLVETARLVAELQTAGLRTAQHVRLAPATQRRGEDVHPSEPLSA